MAKINFILKALALLITLIIFVATMLFIHIDSKKVSKEREKRYGKTKKVLWVKG